LIEIGVIPGHIDVIESGVDIPTDFPPEKSVEPLFVSLNRLVPHKRIDLLLRAWEIAGAVTGGRLIVAGDGPELSALRRQASSIPRVEMLGRVTEQMKHELLGSAWAVISAARHEGWGMSVTEAAILGTPAVAVDAPGIRDAVVDGGTGVLVRTNGDSDLPESFASVLEGFVVDEKGRRELGSNASVRAREFSWDRSVDRWEAVLERAVAEGARVRRSPGVEPNGGVEVPVCD
jgi:glycosyltransferase involved in cell wall biosynthesis